MGKWRGIEIGNMKPYTIMHCHYYMYEALIGYLDRLDDYLRQFNYRLLPVFLTNPPVPIKWDYIRLPWYVEAPPYPKIALPKGTTVEREVMYAAAVEAEWRNEDLKTSLHRVLLYKEFMEKLFYREKPNLCIIYGQFTGFHIALRLICEQNNVPYVFTELGLLPGTTCFEQAGQMAESLVAQESGKFLELSVDDNDISIASRYLDFARSNSLSRRPQTEEEKVPQLLMDIKQKKRKVIFYAGQNDYHSGIQPSWLPKARTHSPFFINTLDALQYLLRLAEKNDWQILFKPHPRIEDRQLDFRPFFADRLTYATGANIFECLRESDVTVTILSGGVAYEALIHNRPLVMLGCNQISGKGCAYEITSRQETEEMILEALKGKGRDEKHENWMKHVAQICKYYLFSMDKEISDIIGRDVDEAARYLIMQCGFPEPLYATGSAGKLKLKVDFHYTPHKAGIILFGGVKAFERHLIQLIIKVLRKTLPQGWYRRLSDFYYKRH